MRIFEISKENSFKFCDLSIDPESDWIDENLDLNECNCEHGLPIQYFTNNMCNPHDFPMSSRRVISGSFYSVLCSKNKHFKGYESVIFYDGKNKKSILNKSGTLQMWGTFYTLILPEYDLMNYEKSVYECEISFTTGDKFVSRINKLVFDAEKVLNLKEDNFFTMAEKPFLFFCTETGKQAIEEAGLTGIAFEEIPVI